MSEFTGTREENMDRENLLRILADEIAAVESAKPLVAIDGVDGSGKSTFTEALSRHIVGMPVIVIHADDFLHLKAVRHRKGRNSPQGFWADTYDYDALERFVLRPLGNEGDGNYRRRATDHEQDCRIDEPAQSAPANCVVLVEGMFLHRAELRKLWDYSVFLDVPFQETARRMALRDGSNPDPEHPSMNRYVGGQRLYFADSQPWSHATRVVDNAAPENPRIIRAEQASAFRDGQR